MDRESQTEEMVEGKPEKEEKLVAKEKVESQAELKLEVILKV